MTVLGDIGALFYIVPVGETFSRVEDVPDYISRAVPYFFLLIVLEFLFGKRYNVKLYSLKDTILSISLGIVQQLLMIWFKELIAYPYVWVLNYFQPYRDYIATLFNVSPGQLPLVYFVVGFLGVDLAYYLFHRVSHEWHFLWNSHSVHHSGERYNLATALRQGALQPFGSWVFYLPLAAIGLPVAEFVKHSRLNTIYQFWIHTEVVGRLPWWIELIFNTPSHHRLHHRPPGNCNYAGVLIIWDRIFGTLHAECDVTPGVEVQEMNRKSDNRGVIYGLARPLNNFDPVYANMQHLLRLTQAATAGGENCGGRLVLRIGKFLDFCCKHRAFYPWHFVFSAKQLIPDILDDWKQARTKTAKSWWSRMWELPPRVDHVVRYMEDHQQLSAEEIAQVPSHDALSYRDKLFLVEREQREFPRLSLGMNALVLFQFVVTLVISYMLMVWQDEMVGAKDEWFRYLCAATTLLCVMSLQSIKLYYF